MTLLHAYKLLEDGTSYLDEPPETPAPLFAIRAFKTAIFGTPHPYQREVKQPVQPSQEDRLPGPNAPAWRPKSSYALDGSDGISSDPFHFADKPAVQARLDPPASPAKGILLTPGTAASRRKTVSFGNMDLKHQKEANQPMNDKAGAETELPVESAHDAAPEEKPRHSTLTRTLIELSKQKPAKEQAPINIEFQRNKGREAVGMDFHSDSIIGPNADVTVDLSQPHSRSGQYWKAKYDQYHKRSHRETKKIIKYGQNVKSYAVKKDVEATSLSEKLNMALAKVATMETEVSKLARQLRSAQSEGPKQEGDHSRLVSDLGQQTAMATKYKKRADELRAALQRQGSSGVLGEPQENLGPEVKSDAPLEVASINAELDSLRATASAAENQAVKLEKENAVIKRSLARVKEEMMSYETRRQAREERLMKRGTKHKAAREECETRLAQLTFAHEELLRTSGELPVVNMTAEIQSIQIESGMRDVFEDQTEANHIPTDGKENARPIKTDEHGKSPYISSRKRRPQNPIVDIWTPSSPREAETQASPSKEPAELPPSSVKHDINRTLKEIDRNLIPTQSSETNQHLPTKPNLSPQIPTPTLPQPPTSMLPSATHPLHDRRRTISSPRPSIISVISSPAKLPQRTQSSRVEDAASGQLLVASKGRPGSLKSRVVGSRTSTMGSGRASSMSLERAAAAKARLARRSAEKRRGQGV